VGARAWIAALAGDETAAEVEADIRAELEAHLALSEEALRAEGRTHDEAESEARERFGDLERTLRACRRVRLGGRLMLVRIQWVLIALLAASTVAFAFYGRQSSARAAVQARMAMEDARQSMAALASARSREPVEAIVVRVGDVLETFDRSRMRDIGTQTSVQRDGQALFPEIGWIEVAGKTRQEVEGLLTTAYRSVYEDITVDVVVHQRASD